MRRTNASRVFTLPSIRIPSIRMHRAGHYSPFWSSFLPPPGGVTAYRPHTLSGSSNYANESKRRPSASWWLRWRVSRTGTRKLAGHILKSAADASAGGGLLTDEGNLPIQGVDAASAHHFCRSSGHTSSIPSPPPTPAPRLPALHVWLTS